jgi:hypothetical protein
MHQPVCVCIFLRQFQPYHRLPTDCPSDKSIQCGTLLVAVSAAHLYSILRVRCWKCRMACGEKHTDRQTDRQRRTVETSCQHCYTHKTSPSPKPAAERELRFPSQGCLLPLHQVSLWGMMSHTSGTQDSITDHCPAHVSIIRRTCVLPAVGAPSGCRGVTTYTLKGSPAYSTQGSSTACIRTLEDAAVPTSMLLHMQHRMRASLARSS